MHERNVGTFRYRLEDIGKIPHKQQEEDDYSDRRVRIMFTVLLLHDAVQWIDIAVHAVYDAQHRSDHTDYYPHRN